MSNYTGKDQDWNMGATTYWFDDVVVFDEPAAKYGIVESGFDTSVVDSDGYPIDYEPSHVVSAIKAECVVTDEMRDA